MDQTRREELYDAVKSILESNQEFPTEWQDEIDDIYPEDSYDALDIVVGHLCMPDCGGTEYAHELLDEAGATSEEIENLLASNSDMYY